MESWWIGAVVEGVHLAEGWTLAQKDGGGGGVGSKARVISIEVMRIYRVITTITATH